MLTLFNVPKSAPPAVGARSLKDKRLYATSAAVTKPQPGCGEQVRASCQRRFCRNSILKCSLPLTSTVGLNGPLKIPSGVPVHIQQKMLVGLIGLALNSVSYIWSVWNSQIVCAL